MEEDATPTGDGEALSVAGAGVAVRQKVYKTMAGNADLRSMLTDFMVFLPIRKKRLTPAEGESHGPGGLHWSF